jgi:hypothetical protein
MSSQRLFLFGFESDTMKATWKEKRSENDPCVFMIRAQLFLSDRPVLGVWIAQIDEDTYKIEKKSCYRQEISIVEDVKEETQERELALHYMEAGIYGIFQPNALEEERAKDRLQTDQQAKEKFQVLIQDMNRSGICSLGLSLELLFDYPGWQKVEWGTPGIKPGQMSEW